MCNKVLLCALLLTIVCTALVSADDGQAQHRCCTTGSHVLKTGDTLKSFQKFLKRIKEKTGEEACGAYGWGRCSRYTERDLYAAEYRMEPTYKVVRRGCPPDTSLCCKGFYKIDHPYLSGQCFDVKDTELAKLLKQSLGMLDE